MNKALSIFKKTLKAILWVVLIFVLLFLVVAGIIQIPSVQTKIVHFATNFVSNKTHTLVEIKNVNIGFPKSVVFDGLFLEDEHKDTLVYAGKAKINIALFDLIFNKININSIELQNLHLNLYNTKTDSLFNYNFLIAAFADTTKQDTTNNKTPSKWTFTVDHVNLKNIKLRYDDEFGGINANLALDKLDLKIDKLDLENSIYNFNDLFVEKLRANVLLTKASKPSDNSSTTILPRITAKNIQINNSTITFGDSINRQSVWADIQRLVLVEGDVDLQKELVVADKIYLNESEIRYKTNDIKVAEPTMEIPASKNEWKVTVRHIDFDNNSLAYTVDGTPILKNTFDANHLQFKRLHLKATQLFYSSDTTKVTVDEFNAIDLNGFEIKRFETRFKMDQHSITAQNVVAYTTNSSFKGAANIQFESLESLQETLPNMVLNVNLTKSGIANSDILYFNPALGSQDFFKNEQIITNISGVISGRINHLKGKKIVINTGDKTKVETDFDIVGLPEIETAYFVFPNMKLISGKSDIQKLVGSNIPQNIHLPENISLLINFKGKMKSFVTSLGMNSSFGTANLEAKLDEKENFSANLQTTGFDMGSLLNDKEMYGPVTMNASVLGHGLDPKIMKAQIKADISEIYLNKYNYQHLTIDGTATGKEFSGKVQLNDKNAMFNFDGLVNMTPQKERYQFNLNLLGADLQKLNFTKDDIRIGMNAKADLKGGAVDKVNGTGGISNLILTSNGKKYILDSVMVASVNQPNKSEMSINSALIGIKYTGTFSPASLPNALTQFINKFFPFSESKPVKENKDSTGFNFEIQLHNHPVLSEVLLPELKEFEPGLITGRYDGKNNKLKLDAYMKRIVYGTTEMNDLAMEVISDSTALNYKLSSASISNSQVNFANFLFDGKLAENKITANLSSIEGLKKKLVIRSEITKDKGIYKLVLDPKNFYLMNNRWDIADDNNIQFGKPGFLIHHLFMNNAQSEVNIASVHDKFNDDLNISIKKFKLDDISRIFEKDTSLIKGNVDGNVLLKRVNNSYGIIADASINNLIVREIPIGNLTLKANNPTNQRFDIDVQLTGTDNNLTASGYYIPNGGDNSIHLKTEIQSLSMKTVEAFSMGQISESSGILTGSFLIGGKPAAPEMTGELTFNNVFMNPSYLNNRIELKHETIQLKSDGVYFNKFTLLDNKKMLLCLMGIFT